MYILKCIFIKGMYIACETLINVYELNQRCIKNTSTLSIALRVQSYTRTNVPRFIMIRTPWTRNRNHQVLLEISHETRQCDYHKDHAVPFAPNAYINKYVCTLIYPRSHTITYLFASDIHIHIYNYFRNSSAWDIGRSANLFMFF